MQSINDRQYTNNLMYFNSFKHQTNIKSKIIFISLIMKANT